MREAINRSFVIPSAMWDGAMSREAAYIANSYVPGPNEAPRDASRERAVAEEQRLRPKVERFFLETAHAIGWDDVVGNDAARTALLEAIEHPILHKDLYSFYGRKPTKGVLLYGPPGCGKTMFGKAAAAVLGRLHKRPPGQHTLLSIAGPEIQSPYVGVTEALIRDVFAYARASKAVHGCPIVVFIDEADAILPCRDGSGTGRRALPWEESNVATFLTEMDGLEDSGAFVILATNRPERIDPALLRDGRCDRRIRVERPDRDAVAAILAKGIAAMPLHGTTPEALLDRVVEDVLSPEHRLATLRTTRGPSFVTLENTVSGAMLVGLAERAKAIAFRRDLAAGGAPSGVTAADFAEAVQDLLRESRGIMPVEAISEIAERMGVEVTAVELTCGPQASAGAAATQH